MNKSIDTTEFLKLRETKFGLFLFINKKPVKIRILNKQILNDLTEKQMDFVKCYI